VVRDVKPWGLWATLGLGLVALLFGELTALMALTWYGVGAAHWLDIARDGVAVTLLICISTRSKLRCWCSLRGERAPQRPTISV
jgi:hypothetical protein